MDQLTDREKLFVAEYLKDLNATQAAIRIGFTPSSSHAHGYILRHRPRVAAAIEAAIGERVERIELESDFVVETILETIQRCRQATPVLDKRGQPVYVETPNGDEVPAYTFDAKNVLKGAELLGRHLGMWKDRVEFTDLTKRSEEELRAELEALRAEQQAPGADLV